MPAQNVLHGVVLDPVHALVAVDFRPPLGREEAITLQSPGSHQDEDAEGRVAESETLEERFA